MGENKVKEWKVELQIVEFLRGRLIQHRARVWKGVDGGLAEISPHAGITNTTKR